jgi:16S rRNA (guanine(966)-N(2))-methyltransferase RsmD
MAKVKAALFNIVSPYVLNSTWLDLYAGTGSVGIEALSRGASFTRFIDNQKAAVRTIQQNLAHTGLDDQAEVLQRDVSSVIQSQADRQFDFMFIAPPQYKGLWLTTLQLIDQHPDWLVDDSWVVVQIDKVEYQEHDLDVLQSFDRRSYGNACLIFYCVK